MNATPMNLNPGNAVQGQAPGAKQGDAHAAEVPFSRVLSGEIARTARGGAEETPASASPAADLAGAALAAGLGAEADRALPTAKPDAAADTLVPLTDTLLGLAITPDALARTAPVAVETPGTAARTASADGKPIDLLGRGAAAGARKDAASLPAAAPDVAEAAGSEAAATFAERLAVARQGDPAGASERVAELMSQPGLRAVAAPPAEATAVHEAGGKHLAPSVGTAAWGQALGEKLVWMASGNQQTASLTLNPPNLGPLQIVVNVSNDQATANFFAAQPEVRQALESAFPRLREMMSEAGIQLGQATVSAETPQQQSHPSDSQGHRAAAGFARGADDGVDLAAGLATPARSGRGLVDTFA
ncbi:putative flagellar hook-length control protein FliK [Thiobacillus denitrificans ATCC 25259]|uniref:Putative flagellar hook-length control protein FliK n=1 Tax=Thiobacillus denitrificans (strain ATCC 25259 / T1) TaxID=292415 RepID=Q3SIH0_THIDA|nr:flagellar hook-length control protein FliK [Thiobacillus denitrificans]AAZ97558.1 putative flagellar hook-length control protein FliK [Thiobacillus denitrificans ATCC 25259]